MDSGIPAVSAQHNDQKDSGEMPEATRAVDQSRSRMARSKDLAANGSKAAGKEKPRRSGAFSQAAEGIRTLDLLHGKQTL
jgi:hypothetical protein